MLVDNWYILAASGLFSGILAGLLGIGGGTILVPILLTLNYNYAQAVASSSLAIVMTSISGSIQNWRMGYLKLDQIIFLGLPGIMTALPGSYLVSEIPQYILETAFGFLLLFNIYLTNLRQGLEAQSDINKSSKIKIHPIIARIGTGSIAGLLAGIFGVGGGVIMVPFQMLFLGEKIKVAIQTSLGVIMITSIAACLGHMQARNVLFVEGIILGIGGLIGAQLSTRYLPKLPEIVVKIGFYALLITLSIYFFGRAWNNYIGEI